MLSALGEFNLVVLVVLGVVVCATSPDLRRLIRSLWSKSKADEDQDMHVAVALNGFGTG